MKKIIILTIALLLSTQLLAQTQSWSKIAQGVSLPSGVWVSGYLYFRTSDSTIYVSTGTTWRQVGPVRLDEVDLPTNDWIGTEGNGTTYDTVSYAIALSFTTGDTATKAIFIPSYFSSLDSMVAYGGTDSTAGDSAALALQVRSIGVGDSTIGAFNAVKIDTIDLGISKTVRKWVFIGLGSITAGESLLFKMSRRACANDQAGEIWVRKVVAYGKGLR